MKSLVKRLAKSLLPAEEQALARHVLDMPRRLFVIEKQLEILARRLAAKDYGLTPERFHSPINTHELKVFSQNGEDGVLLYLFSLVGVTDRRFVEFGMGDGAECNTANLSINFGWRGLLMDCVGQNIARARAFYERRLGESARTITLRECFVTKDNINSEISNGLGGGEIDLLSIDIDGNDYWVWEALTAVNPRIVVIEYNAVFGPDEAVTVPYDAQFNRAAKHPSLLYFGASLAALAKLGAAKGYILAGCDTHGVNAFFIRRDVAEGKLDPVDPAAAYYPLQDRLLGRIDRSSFAVIAGMPLVRV